VPARTATMESIERVLRVMADPLFLSEIADAISV
jgi:hypothetical protein